MEGIPDKSEIEIKQELQAIYDKRLSVDDDMIDAYNKRNRFVGELRERFPEEQLLKTELYHLVRGSSGTEKMEIADFDVPGGLIERFIREEL